MDNKHCLEILEHNLCSSCHFGSSMDECTIRYCDNRSAIRSLKRPIIVIKSTRYRTPTMLNAYHQHFSEQLAENGLILLPNDFEYTLINPYDFEGEITTFNVDKKQSKAIRFLQKVFHCKKQTENLDT